MKCDGGIVRFQHPESNGFDIVGHDSVGQRNVLKCIVGRTRFFISQVEVHLVEGRSMATADRKQKCRERNCCRFHAFPAGFELTMAVALFQYSNVRLNPGKR